MTGLKHPLVMWHQGEDSGAKRNHTGSFKKAFIQVQARLLRTRSSTYGHVTSCHSQGPIPRAKPV